MVTLGFLILHIYAYICMYVCIYIYFKPLVFFVNIYILKLSDKKKLLYLHMVSISEIQVHIRNNFSSS